MPRRPNKKAQRYDGQGERAANAIKDLKENPESKMKHVAAHYGLSRDSLHNYYGKTQAARAAHPEQRPLTEKQERSVEGWVEKRDALGYPPKHKELRRVIVQILNNPEGTRCDRVGDHYISRFLKRHPSVAASVARAQAMDRDRALALNEKNLETYFDDLEDCVRRNEILPDDVRLRWDVGGRRMNLRYLGYELKPLDEHNRESGMGGANRVSATGKRLPAFYIYTRAAHYAG